MVFNHPAIPNKIVVAASSGTDALPVSVLSDAVDAGTAAAQHALQTGDGPAPRRAGGSFAAKEQFMTQRSVKKARHMVGLPSSTITKTSLFIIAAMLS